MSISSLKFHYDGCKTSLLSPGLCPPPALFSPPLLAQPQQVIDLNSYFIAGAESAENWVLPQPNLTPLVSGPSSEGAGG